MRTAKVKIHGVEYTACFSAYVIAQCEERSGSVVSVLQDVEKERVSTALWLLAQMLKAGELYEKMNHIETPKAPTYEELLITTGLEELSGVAFDVINDAITAGTSREVEVESKNAETTQEE